MWYTYRDGKSVFSGPPAHEWVAFRVSGGRVRKIRKQDADRSEITRIVTDAGRLKEEYEAAEGAFKEQKAMILDVFAQNGIDRRRVNYDEHRDVIVSVKERTGRIDPVRLKKAIGAAAFGKITSPAIDKVKLEAALVDGSLDPVVLASCMDPSTVFADVRFGKAPKKKGLG